MNKSANIGREKKLYLLAQLIFFMKLSVNSFIRQQQQQQLCERDIMVTSENFPRCFFSVLIYFISLFHELKNCIFIVMCVLTTHELVKNTHSFNIIWMPYKASEREKERIGVNKKYVRGDSCGTWGTQHSINHILESYLSRARVICFFKYNNDDDKK